MKISCSVIRDILPLYVENMVSEDTKEIVEEHIKDCEECKKELEEMKSSIDLPIDTDTTPLRRIKTTMRRKKIQTIIFSTMVTMVIIAIAIGYLTVPEHIPYHEGLISFIESNDGMVIAIFSPEVTGYTINAEPSKTDDGIVYYINTWDSIWNRNIIKKSVNNIVLNPEGEEVAAVYYYNADGSEDILIYGKDQYPTGGVISLPRLVLSYYFLLAVVLALISGIILFNWRKREKLRNIMLYIFLLPMSYILAHIFIKGFPASTYLAKRDFFAILLVTIPLYIAFILAVSLIKEHRRKRINKGL